MNKALNFKYNFSVECSFAIKIIPQYGVISNLYLIPFIFWLPHPTLHRALYSTFYLIIFFGREQKVTFRVCVHLSNWHYALKSEFLYTRLHQIVLKKIFWISSSVSLKGHHNLSWTGDATKRKVSISNLELKLLSKKFKLFQLKVSGNFCHCLLCNATRSELTMTAFEW